MKKIVIVDDDLDCLENIAGAVTQAGFEFVTAPYLRCRPIHLPEDHIRRFVDAVMAHNPTHIFLDHFLESESRRHAEINGSTILKEILRRNVSELVIIGTSDDADAQPYLIQRYPYKGVQTVNLTNEMVDLIKGLVS